MSEHDGAGAATEQTAADLVVPYKIQLDDDLCAAMAQSFARYLLYLRGQIPRVYEEFISAVHQQRDQELEAQVANGSRKRKLVSGSAKKARKLCDASEELLSRCLPTLFQRRVRSVAVAFGATTASPRELWRIRFLPSLQSTTVENHSLPRDRIVKLCVQKLIRMVLAYATQHFSSPLAVTSMHLLVLAEKDGPPVEGFVPKQTFRLRHPKVKKAKRSHEIHIFTTDSSTEELAPTPYVDDEDGDCIWYQSCSPIQGVSRLS